MERYRPGRGDELETILEGVVDREPFLVYLGYGASSDARCAAVEPGRERGTDRTPSIQHVYQFHGEL